MSEKRGGPDRVKVLVIMGWTRSGSTILDNLLGELDGFFSGGELHYIWQRGLLESRLCACGRALPECELWSAVLDDAFDGSRPDPATVVRNQRHSVRTRHTWKLLRQSGLPAGWKALDSYAPVLTALYHSIARVTGERVIVDSSKRPSDGAILHLLPGIEPYFVQLVRDPRAVAFSWKRRKRELDRPELHDEIEEMPRYTSLYSTFGWTELNLAAESVRKQAGPGRSLLVRYEDFMADPSETLSRLAALLGESPPRLPLVDGGRAVLSGNHCAAGNPSRFRTGEVELRADAEWARKISPHDRFICTTMGYPLLRRYGYLESDEGRPTHLSPLRG
ncbi:MAG: sulfotransferase [Actinomycetota bacterium]